MGNFSFLCKECGRPILSTTLVGQPCNLFLLRDGKVIEEMEGQYDGYGKVLRGWLEESVKWEMDWMEVVDLMSHWNRRNGILAYHYRCMERVGCLSDKRSERDPNQGWDDHFEDMIENPSEVYVYELEETN